MKKKAVLQCPNCGDDKLLTFTSINKKACVACHAEFNWYLDSSQALKIEENKMNKAIEAGSMDQMQSVISGLQSELQAKRKAIDVLVDENKALKVSLDESNELLTSENDKLKQTILNNEATMDRLQEICTQESEAKVNLAKINHAQVYDIESLNDSLLREQRIVDFLTKN